MPNHYLTVADLFKLPVGTTLPTLVRGESLVVTTAGGGPLIAPMRINYVRVKAPDVMRNLKVIVHSLYLPFPHIHPSAIAFDGMLGNAGVGLSGGGGMTEGACSAMDESGQGNCGDIQQLDPASKRVFKPTSVDIEVHQGL